VLALVLCIFALLYVTIGIVSQVDGVFRGLILDAQKQMREGSSVERSAQAVCVGVYSLLLLPFWFIQLPFSFIGSLWSSSRLGTLVVTVLIIAAGFSVRAYWPQMVDALQLLQPPPHNKTEQVANLPPHEPSPFRPNNG
jgi:hypothetical protein